METRSRRRLRVSPPPPPDGGGSRRLPPSSDRISALSDDMLILVLSRLGSVHAAARTGLLSRRWLGLWTSLAHPAFCTDASDKIEAALARFSVSPVVSSIHIRFPVTRQPSSLLRAAARLSPAELVFVLKEESWQTYSASVVLPCLCRATTIEIDAGLLGIRPPPAGEFPALEKLFVAGDIIDFGSLLSRCPCLRVLGVTFRDVNPDSLDAALATLEPAATVHSLELPLFSVQIGTRWRNLLTPLDSAAFSAPISPPPSGNFPVLEKLSLSGNIVDLGTLLSRCPRLRVLGVVFRGMVDLRSLEAALAALEAAAAALGVTLSLLGINTRWTHNVDAAGFGALLHAMARLSVQKLVLTHHFGTYVKADLACFDRAMSIEMDLKYFCFTTLLDGEFSMLERLSITESSSIVDLSTLLKRCPCLRVLKVAMAMGDVTVHSASLLELDVHSTTECHHIDIVTPVLKKLELKVWAGSGRELSVSISAPMVEKVTWKRWYTTSGVMFGFWRLECASLKSQLQEEDTSSQHPRVHALCLHISCIVSGRLGSRPNFAKEMAKLLITDFSVLELRLRTREHIFGALVLRILGMHQIRAATEKLKIVILPWWSMRRQACPGNCLCGNPKNWRRQSISLPHLREVEIDEFTGEGHEYDFLGFISKCSPMLKRVTVKLAYTLEGGTTM
ncbi:hypothetical protein ACQ4PT_036500 [Festuca glaucescens]